MTRMRMRICAVTLPSANVLASFIASAMFVFFFAPNLSEAKNRPTVSSPYDCWGDLSCPRHIATKGELISWCCYDDGCWICDAGGIYSACDWVSKLMRPKGGVRAPPANVGVKQPPSPPPKYRTPATPPPAGVLQGDSGFGPQGPAPTGGSRGTRGGGTGGTGTLY